MNGLRAKPPDLDAIRARADKATPGPWYPVVNDLVGGWSCSTVNAPASHGPSPTPADFCSLDDAKFIAHAREDVPALLAHIERLREALPVLLEAAEEAGYETDPDYPEVVEAIKVARAALAAQESAK